MRTLLLLFFSTISNLSFATETTTQNLTLTYSLNQQVCHEAALMLRHDKVCRPYDFVDRSNPKKCSPEEAEYINIKGNPMLIFKEIATNEYGYTQIFTTTAGDIDGYAIIYLNQFNGDNFPLTVETWKVDAKALNDVLALPPGPVPYNKGGKGQRKEKASHPKDTMATDFSQVLNQGEKLSDDWSPIIYINDSYYFAERECAGVWDYGGIYSCDKVIRLTLKKIAPEKKAVDYCQFTRAKRK